MVVAVLLSMLHCATGISAPTRALRVTVIGDRNDPRALALQDAVTFWNQQLEELRAPKRFGPVDFVARALPEEELAQMSERMEANGHVRFPAILRDVTGDVVVVLSEGDFASFTLSARYGAPAFVAIRRGDVPPLSRPNVARNVIAHELGHVLGLSHNADPSTLMCGRPARCRPGLFQSSERRFFPLTAEEKEHLTLGHDEE